MRFDRLGRAALATALLLGVACSSSSRSFIVLTLKTSVGVEIPGVTAVDVKVSRGSAEMSSLTYPASNLTLDAITANTLSVNFNDDETGEITFDVEARKGSCVVGRGTAKKEIKQKDIVYVDVPMAPVAGCNPDGGTDGSPEGGVFLGCDPVSPTVGDAGVQDGGAVCAANQTCQVNCATERNECTRGGSGAPGAVCTSNADCQAGTQCFDYSRIGCQVKVCLRFCNNGGDCAAFGDGGGGPGSVCEGPVRCPTFDTAYHTCTFNCDPRAAGAATRGGCPDTLACVALAGMDQVDCTCPGTTRTKDIGATCSPGGADCKPGLVCNGVGTPATYSCRAICGCNSVSNNCTAPNDCTGGTQCRPVANSTMFGVCL